MTETVKKHDYQNENQEKLVDALYKSTLEHFPGIPIPDEELAKELLRVGVKARCGAEELTTLKDHLAPYRDEDIRKIHEEKMQLVTAAEFKAVHRQMLEQTSELEKKLAVAVETLKKVHEVKRRLEYTSDFGIGFQPPTNALAFIHLEVEQALAEIGDKLY